MNTGSLVESLIDRCGYADYRGTTCRCQKYDIIVTTPQEAEYDYTRLNDGGCLVIESRVADDLLIGYCPIIVGDFTLIFKDRNQSGPRHCSWQDLWDLLPSRRDVWLTSVGTWGRIGHQFSDIVSGMIIAELFGFQYFYSGFHGDHFAINEYLNFGDLLTDTHDIQNPVIEISTYNNAAKWHGMSVEFMRKYLRYLPPKTNVIFKNSTFFNLWNLFKAEDQQIIIRGLYQRILAKLRNMIPHTKLYKEFESDFHKSDKLGVAVYVRAGGSMNDNAGYEQSRAEYDVILQRLRNDYPDTDLDIRVYSQGPLTDLADFSDFEIIICDEQYPLLYQIMKTLLTADVFVAGLSSFSAFISILRTKPTYWHRRNRFRLPRPGDVIV